MTENDTIYTFEKMDKIRRDIEKIKNKKFLNEVRNIILTFNPNISITKNENGIYLYFHNLKHQTYTALTTHIKKYKSLNEINKVESIDSDCITYSNIDYPFEGNSKLKYSNREKNIIKRKMYDFELKTQNHEINDNTPDESNSVFIKK